MNKEVFFLFWGLLCGIASAANGFTGAVFLVGTWVWLNFGLLPDVQRWGIRVEPYQRFLPHLLLVLIVFLLLWQIFWRGRLSRR